jgi:RNA-binding protein YlmH
MDNSSKLLEAHIEDMAERCSRTYSPQFTFFLDERQGAEAEIFCLRHCGEMMYMMWGGYEEAQRKILCIFPEYAADSIIDEFPLKCVTFSYRKEDRPDHRNFLGSLMALRLKREAIGDIVIAESEAQVFVTDIAAKLIMSSISKIGRVGVKLSDSTPFHLEKVQEFIELSGITVASMRLDCITAAAAHISRENAARLIRAEKVSVNHFTITSVSHEVRQGDVLSVRGSGRFILHAVNGETKKGRIHIILRKYK